MAKQKTPIIYGGMEYDSTEEVEFQIFLNDCKKYGLVSYEVYQPESFTLVPKSTRKTVKHLKTKPDRVEEKVLFHSHMYTPDWDIVFEPKFFEVFPKHGLFIESTEGTPHGNEHTGNGRCLVDIKGAFNPHGGDRIFPIHQKLMWYSYHRIVNKVIPQKLFTKIGAVPDELKWMKNRKQKTPKKVYQFTKTIDELFKNNANQ